MLNPFKASSSLDEVVFANRNKAYGAYAIRKQYDANVVKSLSIVASALILLFLTGFINKPSLSAPKPGSLTEIVKPIEVELITFSLPASAPAILQQSTVTSSADNQNYRVQADQQVITDVIPVTDPTTPQAPSTQGTATGVPGGSGNINVESTLNTDIPSVNEPLFFTETMPLFNNGVGDVGSYLAKEINYPQRAVTVGVSGKVVVRFDVAADGSVTNIIIEKGIGFGCDEEAIRVVSAMPRWKPGLQNGKAVPVRMRLPIKFEIQ